MFVEELNLQQTLVVLQGTQVEGYLQLFRGRNLALHTGIVEGVAIL